MRLPFFRNKPPAPPERKRQAKAASDDPSTIEAARTRARRRLVGALVLLVIGVVGFPILFETQPRPLPVDTPIEAPRREPMATPAPAMPVRKPAPVLPVDAGAEVAAASVPAPTVVVPAAPKPASAPVARTAPPTPSPAVREAPLPVAAAASAAPSPAASAAARFVVQVGAYTDANTLREARAKVEKLGLKTYTQVIGGEGAQRTRVRLGPYATRDEADAAAAKLRRAGLPANILAL